MPASRKHLSNITSLGEGLVSILAKWKDQKYYQVTEVVEIDASGKCRCHFEDETLYWIAPADLHLSLDPEKIAEEWILCSICDDNKSKAPNEIIICDVCNQGYHVQCHSPRVDREAANLDDENSEWVCSTCKDILGTKSKADKPIEWAEEEDDFARTPKKATKPSKKSGASTGARRSTTHKATISKKQPSTVSKVKLSKIKLEKNSNKGSFNCNKIVAAATSTTNTQENNNSVSGEVQISQSPEKSGKPTKAAKVKRAPVNSEKMCPEVIQAAKAIAIKDTTNLSTETFVGLITPSPELAA